MACKKIRRTPPNWRRSRHGYSPSNRPRGSLSDIAYIKTQFASVTLCVRMWDVIVTVLCLCSAPRCRLMYMK
jgi:hypothetical protein